MGFDLGGKMNSFLGLDKGLQAGQDAVNAAERFAKEVYFKPYTMISGTGQTSYDPATGTWKSSLSAPFQGAQDVALSGATNLFGQLGAFSPQARQAEIARDLFQQQSDLLAPQFAAQNVALQNKMFGGGRLGLRLAAEGQGLGQGGAMVSPDVLGLGRAQQQTLGQLAADTSAKAYEQSLAELQGLSEAGSRLLSGGVETGKLEQALMRLGVDAETARSMAAAQAGNIGMQGYDINAKTSMASDKNTSDMFGGIASSFGF
jgi:hypothetical protein